MKNPFQNTHTIFQRGRVNLPALTALQLPLRKLELIFSFDSILTAVGLSRDLAVMITAVVLAMIVMLLFAPYVSDFINKYPTMKILALVFLVAIGVLLVLEGLHIHVEKSYVYFGMGFSMLVESMNIRLRKIQHKSN